MVKRSCSTCFQCCSKLHLLNKYSQFKCRSRIRCMTLISGWRMTKRDGQFSPTGLPKAPEAKSRRLDRVIGTPRRPSVLIQSTKISSCSGVKCFWWSCASFFGFAPCHRPVRVDLGTPKSFAAVRSEYLGFPWLSKPDSLTAVKAFCSKLSRNSGSSLSDSVPLASEGEGSAAGDSETMEPRCLTLMEMMAGL